MFFGFGIGIGSPQVCDVVIGVEFARKFFRLWSLDAPCVRIEDRGGLCTVASVLRWIAGYSKRFQGGFVISPGSRSRSVVLTRGGNFRSAFVLVSMDFVLGRFCFSGFSCFLCSKVGL